MKTFLGKSLPPLIPLIVVLAAWEICSRWRGSIVMPGVLDVARALPSTWQTLLTTQTLPTLVRILSGYGIGLVIGSAFGMGIGVNDWLYRACLPYLEFLRSLPATALFPLFLTLVGNNDFSRMLAAIYITTWITAFNTSRAMQQVERTRHEYLTILHASLFFRLRHLYAFELTPAIFTSARVTLSLTLLVMVAVEMLIGTRAGLGKAIYDMHYLMDYAAMFCAILYVGILGLTLNKLAEWVESVVVYWRE